MLDFSGHIICHLLLRAIACCCDNQLLKKKKGQRDKSTRDTRGCKEADDLFLSHVLTLIFRWILFRNYGKRARDLSCSYYVTIS